MLSVRERFSLSISELEYSDKYDECPELFEKGIIILTDRLEKNDFKEFNDEEMEVLSEIYSLIDDL